ncbi:MAG: 4-hydroxy-3-methylbut-2-enyl diphosphate reductase [Bacteroidales bacterium]|nr:4-hydroxy-3-methylbut-2-enyl diphosphate reductase [Bacteroidales bacterium]
MKVSIDPYAGFCFGVKKTIELAEKELQKQDTLYCIGDIVHNQEEINRLKNSGLEITDLSSLQEKKNSTILFRAHGEPPSSYFEASKNELTLIDGTCPIVLKLQKKIKDAFDEMKKVDGQVVIYGSKNHPEVIGLSGNTNNEAIILESLVEIDQINFEKPIRLFAQTTKDKEKYNLLKETITQKINEVDTTSDYKYFNTICGQVSNRVPKLKDFCTNNEIVIFVSGKKSSNGKYLYNICKSANPKSYHISDEYDINRKWFMDIKTVGISGATSTPFWLMEKIANQIMTF